MREGFTGPEISQPVNRYIGVAGGYPGLPDRSACTLPGSTRRTSRSSKLTRCTKERSTRDAQMPRLPVHSGGRTEAPLPDAQRTRHPQVSQLPKALAHLQVRRPDSRPPGITSLVPGQRSASRQAVTKSMWGDPGDNCGPQVVNLDFRVGALADLQANTDIPHQ